MHNLATGSYLPPKIIDNHLLSTMMDTSDDWIVQRTGISERRAAIGQSVAELAAEAAKRAAEAADIALEEIDLIIVGSVTADQTAPSTAGTVQGILGIERAIAFDLVAGCSGFVYALSTAKSMMQSSLASCALVIGAEVFSKVMDYTDRGSSILFGDGSGAMILRKADLPKIQDIYLNARYDEAQSITLTTLPTLEHFPPAHQSVTQPYVALDGKEVYRFALFALEDCIQTILARNHLSTDDITYIIPHQANKRIIQSVAKSMHIPPERFYLNLDRCGNTSAASIPIALDEMNRLGLLKAGDRILLAGFGAGLTWGSILIQL